MNDGIHVNTLRTIRSISPHITSLKSGTGIGFCRNSGDGIPPRNIGSSGFFNRGTSYFSNRRTLWHGAEKIVSENSGGNIIFKNDRRENSFEVEKIGHRKSVILNYTNSNHVNSNHFNLNQLVPADLITINYLADV